MGGGNLVLDAASSVGPNAKETQHILTVGIVTEPFMFEGQEKMNVLNRVSNSLRENCDTYWWFPQWQATGDLLELGDPLLAFSPKADDYSFYGRFVPRKEIQLYHPHKIVNVDFEMWKTVYEKCWSLP